MHLEEVNNENAFTTSYSLYVGNVLPPEYEIYGEVKNNMRLRDEKTIYATAMTDYSVNC